MVCFNLSHDTEVKTNIDKVVLEAAWKKFHKRRCYCKNLNTNAIKLTHVPSDINTIKEFVVAEANKIALQMENF